MYFLFVDYNNYILSLFFFPLMDVYKEEHAIDSALRIIYSYKNLEAGHIL